MSDDPWRAATPPEPVAHTPNAAGRWHPLDKHLQEAASSAQAFAMPFGGGPLAHWAGILHDVGKLLPEVQAYLVACDRGLPCSSVPHARWGAVLAYYLLSRLGAGWEEVALPVLGHHAGLPDAGQAAQRLHSLLTAPEFDMVRRQPLVAALLKRAETQLPQPREGTRRELFIRMLFSALVDADFLDTERHFRPSEAGLRGRAPSPADLWPLLQAHVVGLSAKAKDTEVNGVRREVYDACVRAAAGPLGIYRLTVPTGGGKTLSGLAFALVHALHRQLERVVVAVPYTSIIDQTVREYRTVFGKEAVLEHHSMVPVDETEEQGELAVRQRLATENWDAPLIVTTTVQLFESLFTDRPSRARKLHRLAGSVVVLDEVQTLPPELLRPTTDVLRALAEEYGVTVVFCTATQPALVETPYLQELRGATISDIVPQYRDHFRDLRRVEYELLPEPLSWRALSEQLPEDESVLVVLNTRRDARTLLKLLRGENGCPKDLFHLSTLLCGAHRRRRLAEIEDRLKNGNRVRLISTQVVECGVDISFPLAYRARGPLDRIVQTAGRCNREGGPVPGRVIIFQPEEERMPRGAYAAGFEAAKLVLAGAPAERLHDPELYREYFQHLFAGLDLDKHGIQNLRRELNYPEVAERYRLIREETVPVVVPYADAECRLAEWLKQRSRDSWRRLQPYLVNLYRHEAERFGDDLVALDGGLYWWRGRYDEVLGIAEAEYDPADLIK